LRLVLAGVLLPVPVLLYALSRAWVAGSVLLDDEAGLIALCKSADVGSEEVEELLGSAESSRSFTQPSTWAIAAVAFAMDCDGALFISAWTVANADWAADKLPALSAVPSAVISVVSCVLAEELPLIFVRF